MIYSFNTYTNIQNTLKNSILLKIRYFLMPILSFYILTIDITYLHFDIINNYIVSIRYYVQSIFLLQYFVHSILPD